MNVRTICLAIINGSDSTGYEIRKLVSDGHFCHFVDASYGSIYPALTKLEVDELVTSCEIQQDGKPNRKVYSITDAGRQEFLAALSQPAQKDIIKSPFLLLALCAEFMEPAHIRRALDMQTEYFHSELALIDTGIEDVDTPSSNWVANYGRACLQEGLRYIEENRAELESVAGSSLNQVNQVVAAE